ncbi:MAG: replicative DNA helicase [Planctomycetota bacterium]
MTTVSDNKEGSYAASEPRAAREAPQDIAAEICVLGSMILEADAVDAVVQINRVDHFYRPAHQALFECIVGMRQVGKPIDLVMLRDELARMGRLEAVGGIEYVSSVVDGVPSVANVEYYARIVRQKAMLRELIRAGTDMVRDAYECRDEPDRIVDEAERRVFQIASQHIGDSTVSLKDLLAATFETLLAQEGKLLTGLATGYAQLDDLTAGFQKGEMIVIGARPSMGKTSILLNIAEYMAVVDKVPIVVFSLEMSKEQLALRLLASNARFGLRAMRRGSIKSEEWDQLKAAAGDLEASPLLIDDTPTLTTLQLRAKARRLKAAHNIQAVFVDYLQLMTYHGPADSRQQQITEMSRDLKALARELEVPVICAAQLNRGPTDRSTQRPRMSDLRESGAIEQDADVVALLHNEDYYHRGEPDWNPTGVTELIVAKQRNGPTGTVYLTFLPDCTRFESAAVDSYQP